MKLRGGIVLLAIGVFGAWALRAQTSGVSAAGAVSAYGQDPEDSYLSSTRYTNVYFGFDFDFPESAELKPIPQAASADRRIQLLDLSGTATPHAAISIGAYEYKNKNFTDAKTLLRRELDQELFYGVEELHGIAKTTVGGRSFYYFEVRRGVDQHISLAAEMNGYVLNVELLARDAKLLHDLLACFSRAEFFPSQEALAHAGQKAARYQGPAISAQHLREVRETPPAEHIDPGKVVGHMYSNTQIGMSYEFPEGWTVQSAGAIEPAVERYREKALGEPLLGPRERAVVKLCRKTLISVWRTAPTPDGEVPYDDFGEVTLSAMPTSCFPNVRFPSDIKDPAEVNQFVVGLRFTQPLQRDMNQVRTYEAGGKPFVVTHGTIAYKEQGDALTRRVSVAVAMTEQNGYLLMWLFGAPHDSELRELLAAKVSFDATASTQEAAASVPAAPGVRSAPPQPTNGSASQAANAAPGEATPVEQSSQDAAPAQASSRPSLLRAGENALSSAPGQKPAQKQPN